LARSIVLTDDDGVSTEIQVDDETRAALLLFNERIDEARADERAAKRVAKAERGKDEAASRVRSLGKDSSATAEQKAEAESAYKVAVEDFKRISEDPHAKPEKAPPSTDSDVETSEEPASETAETPETAESPVAEALDPEPTEISADEEPVPAEATAESE
jgi:hypothetical protein